MLLRQARCEPVKKFDARQALGLKMLSPNQARARFLLGPAQARSPKFVGPFQLYPFLSCLNPYLIINNESRVETITKHRDFFYSQNLHIFSLIWKLNHRVYFMWRHFILLLQPRNLGWPEGKHRCTRGQNPHLQSWSNFSFSLDKKNCNRGINWKKTKISSSAAFHEIQVFECNGRTPPTKKFQF